MRIRLLMTCFLACRVRRPGRRESTTPCCCNRRRIAGHCTTALTTGSVTASWNRSRPQNVGTLWRWHGLFKPTSQADIKSTPLLVDGVLYFTVPDKVWAVDALSGHQLWHYTYPPNHGLHIGNRGVGMYKNWLYFLVPDGHLVSLNAKDGSVRWIVQVADVTKGYWTSMAPLVVGNHVLVGTSGDFDNLVGYIRSVDPETGKTQWQWNATPPLGTAGATTGGNTWMTGTYDPDLNLVYWGTGNPTPVLTASTRPGDDLYTCSIVALNPDTGKLAWAFQPSPHDTHDWDAAETPVLVDGMFQGKPRKMLLQSSRNGYFFVLDRTDGSSLLTVPFGPVNWALGVDKQGRPIPESGQGAGARWAFDRAGRGWDDEFSISQFRSEDRTVHRVRASQLQHLLRQAGRWHLRLGRRRLRPVGQGRARGDRLPDRQDSLDARAGSRNPHCGSLDHALGAHLHRGHSRQCSCSRDQHG